ncbi:uncharacterized protein LOC108877609 isoform X3 [Scomber scombrus]|uniref:Uncharacterized protein LOC108877609 isoform X3 n=1 Tax=Scomber scombrus TaxID=13677 RepID=A0AAV1NVN9_SCOSC
MTLRTNYMMSAISSSDIQQSAYEDPEASMPALTDVKVKPVPPPRTKKPNTQCNNNSTVNSVDHFSKETTSQNTAYPAGYKRPRPARPPPVPPVKPTAAVNGSDLYYTTSNTEPTVTSPAITEKKLPSPPRPARPPPPSYYNDKQSTILLKSKSDTDLEYPCRTYGAMTRPPPPSFSPPPPPSVRKPSESACSEAEYPLYLEVLTEDGDETHQTQGRSTPCTEEPQRRCFSSHRQSIDHSEEINGMLRWLKRVSKSDYLTPSLYGLSVEEEIRLFNERAMNVNQALRLYNLLMMKRNEIVRDHISEFASITESMDKGQKKIKNMGIAGGTTGAVGGMTAVVGIALAPMTMGISLIATAIGAGMVAGAGGMGARAAKAKNKNVNRTAVKKLVDDYMANIVDVEHSLDFILSGMNELRRHDLAKLQRAGAQPDAVKMAHLSQSVFRSTMNNSRRTSVHTAGMSSERLLKAFAQEMDQYFKDEKLKQSTKNKFSARVLLLAQNLQDEFNHLNDMWEKFC